LAEIDTLKGKLEAAIRVATRKETELRDLRLRLDTSEKAGESFLEQLRLATSGLLMSQQENERLESQYAALEAFVGTPQAKPIAEIERMRALCEAAEAIDILKHAGYALFEINRPMDDAQCLLADSESVAYEAFDTALAEYRKQKEATQ